MTIVFYVILQLFIIILLAPLINGLIKKAKALTQKRVGPPLLQMYYDLFKLMRKSAVISETSSWIFRATPYIVFSSTAVAALFVPVTTLIPLSGFTGDIIMLVYLLAMGRFFMCLAGLDTGSTFGGMGSSREAMISSIIEPAILVSFFTLGLTAKSTSVIGIMSAMKEITHPLFHPVFLMLFASLLVVIIAETCRIPIDDPSTHLELTMVHEAMILEYSGRHLALMELGASMKQLIFITLLVNLFLPMDQYIALSGITALLISLLIYLIKIILIAILIAVIEVSTVKLRFFSIPNLAAFAFILSFLGFLQYFVLGR